jgi:two-component system LytT family response regulator
MSAAFRTVVVDDEPLARERITTLLRAAEGFEVVGEASNGLEALDRITELAPDVAFIDVEMPELGGLGVVAALDATRVPEIVFITAFEQYALQAFEVGAIDYVQKPVTPQRFNATLARVRQRLGAPATKRRTDLRDSAAAAERADGPRRRFVIRRGTTHTFLPVDDVDWIDAADNYLRLHVGERWHLHRGTMKDAEDELDPARFVRIHRSAIVNVERIASVESQDGGGYIVTLHSGARLRSSRQYVDRVRSLLR